MGIGIVKVDLEIKEEVHISFELQDIEGWWGQDMEQILKEKIKYLKDC